MNHQNNLKAKFKWRILGLLSVEHWITAAQSEQISGPAHCYAILLLFPPQFHPASQGPQCTSKLCLYHMQATPWPQLKLRVVHICPQDRSMWEDLMGPGSGLGAYAQLGSLQHDPEVKAQPPVGRLLGLYMSHSGGERQPQSSPVQGFLSPR